ncbi:MAG: hypothetical protein IIA09_06985 [Proteobacteria bacterium]|nr:hypothetical protein [Pseudomonadota bacterium]
MLQLEVHDEAEEDLERLLEDEPQAAGAILAFLQELRGDPDLLDCLTITDFGKYGEERFSATSWWNEQPQRNLWRVKIWDLENQGLQYRIIYAYAGQPRKYHVLAVVDRDNIDYDDEQHPTTQRVRRLYDDL